MTYIAPPKCCFCLSGRHSYKFILINITMMSFNAHCILSFSHLLRPSPLLRGPVFTIIFQYCLFSVMSAVRSYLVISSRLLSVHLSLGRPLLLYPGTTMSIICLERLSSSLLLTCPYQCNRFCLRNVDLWHPLVLSGF